jgi:hypothetical protein
MPIFALEVISEKYNSEYEDKLADYEALGISYYAIDNPLSSRKGRYKKGFCMFDRLSFDKTLSKQ